MEIFMEIARIVLPIVIVGGIAVFVITRLQSKHKQGKLVKKKTKGAQVLLDSLIPLGLLFGCAVSVILSIFFQTSLLPILSLGGGIGYLFGYFAYEIYSKMGESYS